MHNPLFHFHSLLSSAFVLLRLLLHLQMYIQLPVLTLLIHMFLCVLFDFFFLTNDQLLAQFRKIRLYDVDERLRYSIRSRFFGHLFHKCVMPYELPIAVYRIVPWVAGKAICFAALDFLTAIISIQTYCFPLYPRLVTGLYI